MGSVRKRVENEAIAQDGDVGDGEEVNLSHYFKSADDPSLVTIWSSTSLVSRTKCSHISMTQCLNFDFLCILLDRALECPASSESAEKALGKGNAN